MKNFTTTKAFIAIVFSFLFANQASGAGEKIIWKRIRTPHYNIVFRSNFIERAQIMANSLEYLHPLVGKSLGVANAPVDIFLNNENMNNNGSTSMTRVILYTLPPSEYNFAGGLDWLLFLSSHELRHVSQYNVQHQGLVKFLYYIGGPLMVSNLTNLFSNVPQWLAEGDAICTETALSTQGRARLPFYLMKYKSILLEREEPSYYDFHNKLNKFQVPNHYILGYVLTSHMRRKYGADCVRKIYDELASIQRLFFPTAIKKVTGRSITKLYKEANAEFRELWQKQLEGLPITDSSPILRRKNGDYADYIMPYHLGDDYVVALKTNKYESLEFVCINPNTKEEKVLVTPNVLLEKTSKFSASGDFLMWVEKRRPIFENLSDLESGRTDRTAIILYDIKTGHRKTISEGRYLTAALSHNCKYIATVVSDESYHHYISIIDLETCRELRRLPNPDNRMYLCPSWTSTDKSLVSVVAHNGKSSIEIIDADTGASEVVLHPSDEHIGNAIEFGGRIFYSSSYSGIDNIYAIKLQTNERFQVTSKKYGAFAPNISADGKRLYFSNYTKDGLDIEVATLDEHLWVPIKKVIDSSVKHESPIADQEKNKIVASDIPKKDYPVENYYPILHLFKIGGWMPEVWLDVRHGSVQGLQGKYSVRFDDLVDWFTHLYTYTHLFKDTTGIISAELELKKLYPTLKIEASVRHDYDAIVSKALNAEVATPIAFPMFGFMYATVKPYITPTIISRILDQGSRSETDKSIQYSLEYKLDAGNTSYMISPLKFHLGLVYAKHYRTLNVGGREVDYAASSWGGMIKMNLPSFIEDNAFIIKGVYQDKNPFASKSGKGQRRGRLPENFRFVDNLKHSDDKVYEGKMYSGRVSYVFPIMYPDFGVGYYLYFKRISASIFSENTFFPEATKRKKILSLGAELYIRFHILSLDHKARGELNKPWDLYFGYSYSPHGLVDSEHDRRHIFNVSIKVGKPLFKIYDSEESARGRR